MSLADEATALEPGASLEEIGRSLLINSAGGDDPTPQPKPDEQVDDDLDRDAAAPAVDDPIDDDQGELGEPLEDDADAELQPDDRDDPGEDIVLDDNFTVEVKADDRMVEVTLAELKKSYSGQKAIQNRLEKAAVTLREADEAKAAVLNMGNALAAKLQQVDQILEQQADPETDWDALQEENPTEWAYQRELRRTNQEQRAVVQQEINDLTEHQKTEEDAVMKKYVTGEVEKLREAIPEFRDPEKAKVMRAKLIKFGGEQFGFTPEEIGGVKDSRPLIMLYKYYQLSNGKQVEVVERKKRRRIKPMIKPGAGTRAPGGKSAATKQKDRLHQRARETGHPDDVAMTMFETK